MPLPPTVDREPVHLRTLEFHGYRRADGLYEIDGTVQDVKHRDFRVPGHEELLPAGKPLHRMSVRVVVDESLTIVDIVAVMDAGPHRECLSANDSLSSLRGARIGGGWTARVKALLGRESCTHLVELMIPMATAAFQTIAQARLAQPDTLDASGRPVKIDSCYAYSSDRVLVKVRWPQYHTGDDTAEGGNKA